MARNRRASARSISRVTWWAIAGALIAVSLVYFRGSDAPGVFLSDDEECLARVIRSEMGIGDAKQKLHVAWASRNLADEKGVSLSSLACSPLGPQNRGRPLSSVQSALKSDRRIARKVLASAKSRDPTRGATHFINPRLQNRLAKRGKRSGYKGRNYSKIRRRWRKRYGWEPYYRVGPTLELWGPRKKKWIRPRDS